MVSVNELDRSQGLVADSRVPQPDKVERLSWAMLMMARSVFLTGHRDRCPRYQGGPLLSGSYIISAK